MADLVWKDLEKFDDDILQETIRVQKLVVTIVFISAVLVFYNIAGPAIWRQFCLRVYRFFGVGEESLIVEIPDKLGAIREDELERLLQ